MDAATMLLPIEKIRVKVSWDAFLLGAVPRELAWVVGCLGTEVRGGKTSQTDFLLLALDSAKVYFVL